MELQSRKHAHNLRQERETGKSQDNTRRLTYHEERTHSMQRLLQLLQVRGARVGLTFIRVDRGSRKEVQREGHVPDIDSALALVIVLMKSWSVDHSCVISATSGLCSPHQVYSASELLVSNVVLQSVIVISCSS